MIGSLHAILTIYNTYPLNYSKTVLAVYSHNGNGCLLITTIELEIASCLLRVTAVHEMNRMIPSNECQVNTMTGQSNTNYVAT